MPDISSQFPQYSSGIADGSYAFDFVGTVTIAPGGHAVVAFPVSASTLRIRQVVVSDVTVPKGGSAPSSAIACYFRIDGAQASAGAGPDGSTSRFVGIYGSQNGVKAIARFVASENGVTLFNPNSGTVIIQVELGA